MDAKGLGLKQQLLLAAQEFSGGDCEKTFTLEDLVVSAWKRDKQAWGLRGYEEHYPDCDKINKEMSSRGKGQKGLVDLGFFAIVRGRVYRLTPAGLAAAASLEPMDPISQQKAGRTLEAEVKKILEHRVFKDWLNDPTRPKHFREAGHFWGIAPGTPSKTVRERVNFVEQTLTAALKVLEERGVNEIVEQRGKILFERIDIERCLEFQTMLKQRFAKDLKLLDPNIELV
jgi:hypothetical protein